MPGFDAGDFEDLVDEVEQVLASMFSSTTLPLCRNTSGRYRWDMILSLVHVHFLHRACLLRAMKAQAKITKPLWEPSGHFFQQGDFGFMIVHDQNEGFLQLFT